MDNFKDLVIDDQVHYNDQYHYLGIFLSDLEDRKGFLEQCRRNKYCVLKFKASDKRLPKHIRKLINTYTKYEEFPGQYSEYAIVIKEIL